MQKRRSSRKPVYRTIQVPDGFVPSYKRVRELEPFLTSKGKIVSRSRTHLTQKQQRMLTREIKRARHLALLPYVTVLK